MFMPSMVAVGITRLVELVGGSIPHIVASPDSASVALELRANGEEWHNKNGAFSQVGDWLLLQTAADYEVRAMVNAGDTPTGNIGVWTNMDALNAWSFTQIGTGVLQCALLVEIRKVGGSVAVESKVYNLYCEVSG